MIMFMGVLHGLGVRVKFATLERAAIKFEFVFLKKKKKKKTSFENI